MQASLPENYEVTRIEQDFDGYTLTNYTGKVFPLEDFSSYLINGQYFLIVGQQLVQIPEQLAYSTIEERKQILAIEAKKDEKRWQKVLTLCQ